MPRLAGLFFVRSAWARTAGGASPPERTAYSERSEAQLHGGDGQRGQERPPTSRAAQCWTRTPGGVEKECVTMSQLQFVSRSLPDIGFAAYLLRQSLVLSI